MKRSLFIIAVIASGLCACNKVMLKNEAPERAAAVVYHMSLQASFDARTKGVEFGADGQSISSQFATTDNIYVYNCTKGAFARYYDNTEEKYLLQAIHPSNLSDSDRTCDLEGDLTFYKLNDLDEWVSVEVAAEDTYNLYYQMNDPDYFYSSTVPIPRFDYSLQDGSASGASGCDFAEATGISMSLSESTLTNPDNVRFENLQSMFRQRLSFSKGGVAVAQPTIKKLTVGTANETFLMYDRPGLPVDPQYDGDTNTRYWAFDSFDIDDPVITSDGDIYLALAFYYTDDNPATGDQLILTAVDNEGNVYQCANNVPGEGFQKNMYYYGNCELVWLRQTVMPTVTRSDGGDESELEPNDGLYDIYGDPAEITISGNSVDYLFYFNDSAFVTLTGNGTASSLANNNDFICAEGDLTIVLDSDYTIICPQYGTALYSYCNLYLGTTGAVQTLTVTTNDTDYSGIYGWDNYDNGTEDDVSELAADGFTVSCSEMIDNGDGTYTWIYTVAPDNVGKVLGADGVVYADAAAATDAGTTAEAMIAFVGRIEGVCANGLAISMTDIADYQMNYTAATGEYAIPTWASNHPVTGGTWRLPTENEWQYMMWGYYIATPEAAPVGDVVKSVLAGGYYWTSTSIDEDNAKGIYYDGTTNASVQSLSKDGEWHVRACLSF